jgi:hypothetical protein
MPECSGRGYLIINQMHKCLPACLPACLPGIITGITGIIIITITITITIARIVLRQSASILFSSYNYSRWIELHIKDNTIYENASQRRSNIMVYLGHGTVRGVLSA